MAQEWFPHDYIPYRLGRDFDKEPWTPDQPRLTGVAQTAFEVNLLTEDNLPSYHRLIHGMFGTGDGAWINWIGRWTAEEGRHAIVLRDYLTVTRNIDPILLERGRMTQLQQGYDRDVARPAARPRLRRVPGARDAHLASQHRALLATTRSPTGSWSASPRTRTCTWSSTATSSAPRSRSIRRPRSRRSSTRSSPSRCPAPGSPASCARPPQIAKAGIYDLRIHRDEVLLPILKHWGIFELTGLDAAAEAARERLVEHLASLDEAAKRFEARLA